MLERLEDRNAPGNVNPWSPTDLTLPENWYSTYWMDQGQTLQVTFNSPIVSANYYAPNVDANDGSQYSNGQGPGFDFWARFDNVTTPELLFGPSVPYQQFSAPGLYEFHVTCQDGSVHDLFAGVQNNNWQGTGQVFHQMILQQGFDVTNPPTLAFLGVPSPAAPSLLRPVPDLIFYEDVIDVGKAKGTLLGRGSAQELLIPHDPPAPFATVSGWMAAQANVVAAGLNHPIAIMVIGLGTTGVQEIVPPLGANPVVQWTTTPNPDGTRSLNNEAFVFALGCKGGAAAGGTLYLFGSNSAADQPLFGAESLIFKMANGMSIAGQPAHAGGWKGNVGVLAGRTASALVAMHPVPTMATGTP
jgi:hypothetical protein